MHSGVNSLSGSRSSSNSTLNPASDQSLLAVDDGNLELFEDQLRNAEFCNRLEQQVFENGNNILHKLILEDRPDFLYAAIQRLRVSDLASELNETGYTPLQLLILEKPFDTEKRLKALEMLMKNSATLNTPSESGQTALHLAAYTGDILFFYALQRFRQSIRHFPQHYINPNLTNRVGETAIHLLVLGADTRTAYAPDECISIDDFASCLNSLIDIFKEEEVFCGKFDVNCTHTGNGDTALHLAASLFRPDLVRELLLAPANYAVCNQDGQTPIHRCIRAFADLPNNEKCKHEIEEKVVKTLKAFENHMIPIDTRDQDDKTPLMEACARDLPFIVDFLLKLGASVHAETNTGSTPLNFAVERNAYEIVELLLKNGANPNHAGIANTIWYDHLLQMDETLPLEKIQDKKRVLQHLLTYGAQIDSVPSEILLALSFNVINLILTYNPKISRPDGIILRGSKKSQLIEYLDSLSEKQIHLDAETMSPIQFYDSHLKGLSYKEQIKKLHTRDADQNTVLHRAAAKNNLELVGHLLEHGCPNSPLNIEHLTPLDLAIENHSYQSAVKLLESGSCVLNKTMTAGWMHFYNQAVKNSDLEDIHEFLKEQLPQSPLKIVDQEKQIRALEYALSENLTVIFHTHFKDKMGEDAHSLHELRALQASNRTEIMALRLRIKQLSEGGRDLKALEMAESTLKLREDAKTEIENTLYKQEPTQQCNADYNEIEMIEKSLESGLLTDSELKDLLTKTKFKVDSIRLNLQELKIRGINDPAYDMTLDNFSKWVELEIKLTQEQIERVNLSQEEVQRLIERNNTQLDKLRDMSQKFVSQGQDSFEAFQVVEALVVKRQGLQTDLKIGHPES